MGAQASPATLSRAEPDAALDTFPKYLIRNAKLFAGRVAMREKDLGIWQSWTWDEVLSNVRVLAFGLADLGVGRGDKVAICGDNRPALYWTFAAAQSLGAVPVPVYQDAVAEELRFVLQHAEIKVAVVENQEQVDKLLSIKAGVPTLERIVYSDSRGLRHYDQPELVSLEEVLKNGRGLYRSGPDLFETWVAAGKGSDISVICYTSGTTGQPKGVMLSFDNLVSGARLSVEFDRIGPGHEILSYLPMAWAGDHYFSYAQSYVAGFAINCPESADTVLTDLRDIGPAYFFAPPRIFENILTSVMIRMADAGWIKRGLYDFFMKVARRAGVKLLEGRPVPVLDRLLYAIGRVLVYGPLKNTLGLTRVKLAYTAGEAIGPDIFDFFRSLGVNLKQLYGQTESAVYLCIQKDGDVRADTVGPPAPSVEVKIAESGEVLYRSPTAFVGYFKNPEATAATKTADGWVHTGDAGTFTAEGHLKIVDRAKDVGRLQNGALFAPKYIENKLKFFPYIKEAVAFGQGRDCVGAFINIDLGAVGSWAERHNLPYTSYTDLAQRPEVYQLIQGCIEQVNRDLAAEPQVADAQVRRFLILHKELDADDGELTRTRKVRRGTVGERYGELVEALFSGAQRVPVEARVTFEDGRTGVIRADVAVADAATFAPDLRAAA
ncbi:AMP-binding protein [Desertibaculum subflavum]|uniref:AMP-binding protein n=1 Tax=Desertibaculum subflavum TaxID=2268458 RepID=UPI000E675D94